MHRAFGDIAALAAPGRRQGERSQLQWQSAGSLLIPSTRRYLPGHPDRRTVILRSDCYSTKDSKVTRLLLECRMSPMSLCPQRPLWEEHVEWLGRLDHLLLASLSIPSVLLPLLSLMLELIGCQSVSSSASRTMLLMRASELDALSTR